MFNFDLDISHYNKSELEDLLNLSDKNYSRSDIEKSMTLLKNQVESDIMLDASLKIKTTQFLLTAKETLTSFIETKTFNHFTSDSMVENQNHFVMEKKSDEVNPVKRETITRVLNFDTLFRENIDTTDPTKFTINLEDPINKVIGMELTMFELPGKILNISEKLGNNHFHLKNIFNEQSIITIPDGTYNNTTQLIDALVEHNDIDNVTYINQRLTIEFAGAAISKCIFNLDKSGNTSNIPFYQRLGYILGFRTTELITDPNNLTITPPSDPIFNTSNYFYLSVNDFQQNVVTNFIPSMNGQKIPPNTLARISIADPNRIVVFNGDDNNSSPERKYFGPCDIRRLDIQLLDKFNRHVDTMKTDFSFAITFKCIYN